MHYRRLVTAPLLVLSTACSMSMPRLARPTISGAEQYRLQILQDENGRIPAGALMTALRQIQRMKAAKPDSLELDARRDGRRRGRKPAAWRRHFQEHRQRRHVDAGRVDRGVRLVERRGADLVLARRQNDPRGDEGLLRRRAGDDLPFD